MSGDGYPLGADCDVDSIVAWRDQTYPQRFIPGIDPEDLDWVLRSGTLWILPVADQADLP